MTEIGFAVLLAGAVLLAIEAHVPTAGLVGAAGLLALVAGAALAATGAGAGLALSMIAALSGAALAGGSLLAVSRRVGRARAIRPRGGSTGLVGRLAVVRSWTQTTGSVSLDGALWNASSGPLEVPESLEPGDAVVVDRVHGLSLTVRKAEPWEVAP